MVAAGMAYRAPIKICRLADNGRQREHRSHARARHRARARDRALDRARHGPDESW